MRYGSELIQKSCCTPGNLYAHLLSQTRLLKTSKKRVLQKEKLIFYETGLVRRPANGLDRAGQKNFTLVL